MLCISVEEKHVPSRLPLLPYRYISPVVMLKSASVVEISSFIVMKSPLLKLRRLHGYRPHRLLLVLLVVVDVVNAASAAWIIILNLRFVVVAVTKAEQVTCVRSSRIVRKNKKSNHTHDEDESPAY